MGELLSSPWDQQRAEKQIIHSIEDIHNRHLPELLKHQQGIQQTRKLFDAHGDIRPVHCRYALNTLEALNFCLTAICELLRADTTMSQIRHLPPLITNQSYYPLLSALHHSQDQVSILLNLIDTYRTDCCPPARQSELWYQRRSIREQYTHLSRYLNRIVDLIQVLAGETYKSQYT